MKAELGLVYAGGRGRRMGGADKGAMLLGEKPLHEIVAASLQPMCDSLAVVAPVRPVWLDEAGDLSYLTDEMVNGEPIGPAGALLAGLMHLQARGDEGWMLTAAVDAPFFPDDLVDQLFAGRGSAPASIARSDDGVHPTFGLWHSDCLTPIKEAIETYKIYALHKLLSVVNGQSVYIKGAPHRFLNINTPEDFKRARRVLGD